MVSAALIAAWFHNDTIVDTCKKLIYSMPTRVQAVHVIDAKGGHTKF